MTRNRLLKQTIAAQKVDSLHAVLSRRRLLQAFGVGAVGLTVPTLLVGCSGPADTNADGSSAADGEPAEAHAVACAEEVSIAGAAARKALGYVEESTETGKFCHNCRFYKQPEGDAACGGCEIVAGPIAPEGYCNSWIEVEGG